MEFRILGPLEVVDGGAAVSLGGAKQRALLACLLLKANEVISSDRLIDELWGESVPESGRAALQVRVSQLRKALGPAGTQLLTRPPGYILRLDRQQLDLHRFERLVAEADSADPPVAGAKLREALALWRGPPLADLEYELRGWSWSACWPRSSGARRRARKRAGRWSCSRLRATAPELPTRAGCWPSSGEARSSPRHCRKVGGSRCGRRPPATARRQRVDIQGRQ